MAPIKPISIAGLAIGAGLAILGALIGFSTIMMRVPPSYSKVGPQAFPELIAIALILAGVIMAWRSVATTMERPLSADAAPTDWRAVAIIGAGLTVHFLLLKTLGFVAMAVALFLTVTIVLGSRHYLRDGLIGVVLALVTYVGFTRGLGLQLPAGILAGLV